MSERPQANRHLVSPKYFATLGIPIRAGRDFDERDSSRVPHVVIVNETFARQHFPGENPIGRTLITGMAQRPSQIVGVVADVRSSGLNTPPDADYFLPALQRPEAFTNILVRTNVSSSGDAAGRARGAAIRGPGSAAAAAAGALDARRADDRRSQAGAGAAGRIRGAGAGDRQPRRLQRDGAPGRIPDERDWHSHGARRITARWSCGWCSVMAAS